MGSRTEVPMPDEKMKRAPQDAHLISLDEDYEIGYWSKALGISKERLIKAVKTGWRLG
jgi:hypothetical protein